ncbi:hypothetical protein M3Y94_00757200 [Aphelenchoides besseyi]|nr:hypothetical protein M3Y94_00757200 [Aphelenchoides besseyi]
MDLDVNQTHYAIESDLLYDLRVAQLCCAPFLWSMVVYFAISLPRISLVHKNLRIILSFLPFMIILCTSSHLLFLQLMKWSEKQPRTWLNELLYCIVGFIHLSSSAISASMMLSVVVERTLASFRQHNYEHSTSIFGFILAGQSILCGVALAGVVMIVDALTVNSNIVTHLNFIHFSVSFAIRLLPSA